MSTSDFAYTGNENLEIMRHAPRYNRALCDLVNGYLPTGARHVLDFGAGIGTFSRCLDDQNLVVNCVEPDPRQRQALNNLGFDAVADIREIADGDMDYIFSLNVLEHIEDDAAACLELFRALRPGGHLMIYVPAFELLFTQMDTKVGHYRRYTRSSLRRRLEQAGFQVERIAYFDFLGFFATLALKILTRDSDGALNPRSVRMYDRWLFPLSHMLSKPFARMTGKNVIAYARKPSR